MDKDPIIDEQLERRICRCDTKRIPAIHLTIEEKEPRFHIKNIVPPTFRVSYEGSVEVDKKRRVLNTSFSKPGTTKGIFTSTMKIRLFFTRLRVKYALSKLFYSSVIRSDDDGTIWSEITMRPWCRSILEFFGFLISLFR
jgi:hypothetical protein